MILFCNIRYYLPNANPDNLLETHAGLLSKSLNSNGVRLRTISVCGDAPSRLINTFMYTVIEEWFSSCVRCPKFSRQQQSGGEYKS